MDILETLTTQLNDETAVELPLEALGLKELENADLSKCTASLELVLVGADSETLEPLIMVNARKHDEGRLGLLGGRIGDEVEGEDAQVAANREAAEEGGVLVDESKLVYIGSVNDGNTCSVYFATKFRYSNQSMDASSSHEGHPVVVKASDFIKNSPFPEFNVPMYAAIGWEIPEGYEKFLEA